VHRDNSDTRPITFVIQFDMCRISSGTATTFSCIIVIMAMVCLCCSSTFEINADDICVNRDLQMISKGSNSPDVSYVPVGSHEENLKSLCMSVQCLGTLSTLLLLERPFHLPNPNRTLVVALKLCEFPVDCIDMDLAGGDD
jgi:hypothetical protein